jgi:hypothetical protein
LPSDLAIQGTAGITKSATHILPPIVVADERILEIGNELAIARGQVGGEKRRRDQENGYGRVGERALDLSIPSCVAQASVSWDVITRADPSN